MLARFNAPGPGDGYQNNFPYIGVSITLANAKIRAEALGW